MANADEHIISFLANNVEEELDIFLIKAPENQIWNKSLSGLPIFTIKEIERHRKKCGKGKDIEKTTQRGRMFQAERYISSDEIYTKVSEETFFVRGKCRASMKQEKRTMEIRIDKTSSDVVNAYCDCPAGKSGYCNHIMGLLFEVASYSLNELKTVPEEVACTSKHRQWGIPSDKFKFPKAVMTTSISRTYTPNEEKKRENTGITCTLYDPRENWLLESFSERTKKLSESQQQKDPRIGFGHVINTNLPSTFTKFGNFSIGSPLGYQLALFDPNFKIVSAFIPSGDESFKPPEGFLPLPHKPIPYDHETFPKNWGLLTYTEMSLLQGIFPETLDASQNLEKDTIGQSKNEFWFQSRKNRLTSSQAHKIYIRKRNFPTLIKELKDGLKNVPKSVRNALDHGKEFESVALEKFFDFLTWKLKQNVCIRSTGLVVQSSLFWIGASPDGLMIESSGPVLIEIKCPYSKRNLSPSQIVEDPDFYVGLKDEKPFLKPNDTKGYYTQVQVAMGLSQLKKCYFIVYTFQGLVICVVNFDESYFIKVIHKLNDFYKFHYLPYLLG